MLARHLEPEWLDELSVSDPRALRARRDLARVNAWMLQPGIMARALRRHWRGAPPRSLIDLGSGDGTFLLSVARRLAPHWPQLAVTIVDRQDAVTAATRAAFGALSWNVNVKTADVLDFLAQPVVEADIITANLFLHHFSDDTLTRLLAAIAKRARLLVACEPRRSAFALQASRLVWAIGCGDVVRHDSVVSVRAGFNDAELTALWQARDGWQLHEYRARLFTHGFVAQRVESSA
jgi:2-polyprenyl-3-methyl-5-hydroxy-6-metoxy-1,4-benzoquinol methylase